MPKITIDHIARETGLSRGTVSRALNDRPDIGAATRQRVLDACAKLNYTPSTAARSLAMGRHFALALLVSAEAAQQTGELMCAAALAAHAGRYSLQLIVIPNDAATTRIRALSADRIDGLMMHTRLSPDDVALLIQTLPNRPMVALSEIDGLECDIVTADSREGGRLAAAALLSRGSQRILHLRQADCPAHELHRSGFVDACRAGGAAAGRVTCETVNFAVPSAALSELVSNYDGIASASSEITAVTIAALAGNPRVAGRNIAIVGSGPADGPGMPALAATIDPLESEIARRAIELLIQRIERGRLDDRQVVRVAPLVVNNTTANT